MTVDALAEGNKARGHLALALRRLFRKKIAVISISVLVVVYGAGILAPWVSPYEYQEQDYTVIRNPPSIKHVAGTDRLGRDVFSRVLWGVQNTAILTLVAMATGGLLIGVSMGLIAGYKGGRVDDLIMRVGEVFASFPDILLVIILAATLRPRLLQWVRDLENGYSFFDGLAKSGVVDYLVVAIALVSFGWIGTARLIRGQVLFLKESQHVEAAIALGASTSRILFIHLLPNAVGPLVVTVTMGMGTMVGTEIILSWLGLGIQPPRPSLGTMLLQGSSIGALRNEPWMLLAPGVAAWTLVLAWNLLGDSLSDVLNPRTR